MNNLDNEWGFFVDLENYSNFSELRPKKQVFKNILETKLYSINESEEIYYDFEYREIEEYLYYSKYQLKEKENLYTEDKKTKIKYYISLGIMITGFSFTFLITYYDFK